MSREDTKIEKAVIVSENGLDSVSQSDPEEMIDMAAEQFASLLLDYCEWMARAKRERAMKKQGK
jgi:hypothetical protein